MLGESKPASQTQAKRAARSSAYRAAIEAVQVVSKLLLALKAEIEQYATAETVAANQEAVVIEAEAAAIGLTGAPMIGRQEAIVVDKQAVAVVAEKQVVATVAEK